MLLDGARSHSMGPQGEDPRRFVSGSEDYWFYWTGWSPTASESPMKISPQQRVGVGDVY